MKPFRTSILILAGAFAVASSNRECDAQNWFVNDTGKLWVTGRQSDDSIPHSDGIKAVVIQIINEGDDDISARVFVYHGVDEDNGHYIDMEELTTAEQRLFGHVATTGKRQTVKLKNSALAPLRLFLTAIPIRASNAAVVICRFKFKPDPVAAGPCDDVPTEDILEEEPIDPDGNGEPDADPAYIEEPLP
jgi:hypothetical protein